MEETKLFPSKICSGYFGTKRFDRKRFGDEKVKKIHMISASGLSSIGGEHATTINGNGVNPDIKDLIAVADNIGINLSKAKEIAQMVEACVKKYGLV